MQWGRSVVHVVTSVMWFGDSVIPQYNVYQAAILRQAVETLGEKREAHISASSEVWADMGQYVWTEAGGRAMDRQGRRT